MRRKWGSGPPGGKNDGVRVEIVDELEDFIRRGGLWDPAELRGLIALLETESDEQGDPILRMLTKPLRSLLTRMEMGDVPSRFANDIEGILYPRLWKVMEAVRDELPDGELRTRVEVLNRRLARRFVEEQDGTGPGRVDPL